MKSKRLIVFLAILTALLTGCSATIEYITIHDTNGDSETYIDVSVRRGDLVEMYGAQRVVLLERWMQNNASLRGFTFEVEDWGYRFYKFTEYVPSDDDEDDDEPTYSNFLFRNYTLQNTTYFHGLDSLVQGYQGDPDVDDDSLLGELLYGYRTVLLDGTIQYVEVDGFWDIVDNDPELISDVKTQFAEVKLYYEMQNGFMGFFSNADSVTRSYGVASHRWDLTNNPNRIIQFGQNLPNAANWYIALLILTGLFIATSIGIHFLRKSK